MNGNRIQFRLAAYTDPAGKWNEDAPKKGNEDDLFVDADLSSDVQGQFMADEVIELSEAGCLMAVADGMGGMNAGEVASAIAIQTVKSAFSKDSLTDEILSSVRSRTKYLEKVVVEADSAIKKKSHDDKECEGMGSTLILAWLYDDELTVTWCGDSRAYLFRDTEGIRQISKDHSYVQGLVDAGSITEVEAFDHPYGNIITRSLGDPEKKAQPESITVPVCKGDIIMLCSDGLSGVLRDRKSCDREGNLIPGDNLEDIIRANRISMTACREALWAAAENADWYDNVTAVLCEIVDGKENKMDCTKDCHEDIVSSKDNMNNSFINIRIHKKELKIIGIAIAVILILTGTFFAGKRYIHMNGHESVWTKRDLLLKESEALGLIFISEHLASLKDEDDFMHIKQEFDIRKELLYKLDSISEKADTSLSGSLRVVSSMKDSVKMAETADVDIDKLGRSIEIASLLMSQIDDFLKQNKTLSRHQRDMIRQFRNNLVVIDYASDKDLEEWERLSRQMIKEMESSVLKGDRLSAHSDETKELTPVMEKIGGDDLK